MSRSSTDGQDAAPFISFQSARLTELLELAFRVARGQGLSPVDAEDVSSLTMLSYLEAENVRQPIAWVCAVARRQVWSLRRKRAVRSKFAVEELNIVEELQSRSPWSLENLLDVKDALDALGPAERTAVIGRDLRGESLLEIADTSGVSVSTIARKLKRGHASLQRSLRG